MKWCHALSVILAVAAVTHLYPVWEIPLFGDELGVLLRTEVTSYRMLVEQSVMEQDVHPLGVQSLYYLLYGLWNWPVWALKLLSALAGIGSIVLIAFIGKLSGRPKTGLMAAALMAVLQMSLFYSVLIRPYAFGQLLFLAYVAGHYRWVASKRLNLWRILLLGLLLCALGSVHYMALLSAVVFYAVALADDEVRAQWKSYFFIAVVALTAYLPQIPVFLSHLGKGNPGNWLTAADASFFADFAGYLVHYSWFFGGWLVAIIGVSFFLWLREGKERSPLFWKGAIVFTGVVVVNLIYAAWRGPILQFSTLYFALPLVFLFLLSASEALTWRQWIPGSALLLTTGLVSLIGEREHFQMITKSDRTTLNQLAIQSPSMSSFLLQPEDHHDYFYRGKEKPLNTAKLSFQQVSMAMLNADGDSLGYGYNLYQKFERIPWLYDHFGSPIEKVDLFNAQFLKFGRKNDSSDNNHLKVIDVTSQLRSKDSLAEYSPVLRIAYDSLTSHPYNFITLRLTIKADAGEKNSMYLTVKCVKNDNSLAVNVHKVSDYVSSGERGFAYVTFAPFAVPGNKTGSTMEFYLWNPDRKVMSFERAEVLVTEGNRYMYSLLRPIAKL